MFNVAKQILIVVVYNRPDVLFPPLSFADVLFLCARGFSYRHGISDAIMMRVNVEPCVV